MRRTSTLIITLAVGLAAAGCSGGSDKSTATATETSATSTPADATTEATRDTPASTAAASSTASADATTPPATSAPVATSAVPVEVDWTQIDAVVTKAIADHQLNGAGLVLVDADTGVVGQKYWGDFNADHVSLIASSSKMVTASVVLGLATDGVIDLDKPISQQVSWTGGNPTITPAELMSSQSGLVGLAGVDNNPAFPPYVCQFMAPGTLTDCAKQVDTTKDDDPYVVPPRTEFRYGGAQWQVAGGVATDVSGKSWNELLNQYVVEPCGLKSLGYTNHWAELGAGLAYPHARFNGDTSVLPVTENPSMEGGVYTNPGDYAQVMLMHLRGGKCGDTQVIDPELIKRAHTNQLDPAVGDYGFGWFVQDENTVADPGAFGSVAWLDLDDGVGAWLVIEDTTATGNAMMEQLAPLVREQLHAS